MLHRSVRLKPVQLPLRRVRVLIEAPDLTTAALDGCETAGMDISICSGPASEWDVCPLVLDGVCPLGSFDVVVTDLEGPWMSSIECAWHRDGVVVTPAPSDPSWTDAHRFESCVGAALGALFASLFTTEGDVAPPHQ